jgi:hypothetical protein
LAGICASTQAENKALSTSAIIWGLIGMVPALIAALDATAAFFTCS